MEEISSIRTFYAAVARKDKNDFSENRFQKEYALSPEQDLQVMTIWAA